MKEDEDIEVKRIIDKMLKELISKKTEHKEKKTVVHLTDKNFEKALREHKVVVVDFWAEWCMPCKFYKPIFERVASKFAGKALFAKLNVDENPATPAKLGITAIPTTIIFVNGRPAHRMVGLIGEEELARIVQKFVQ
ncbi:MAG: thioredoxin [Candidatus Methanomethylicota archaeon]|uniref:Thioredoxin n=1 Tax=Thermoproteota archaeon TaxID=2056631 RepID=A0A497EVR7_9CREN|nr:MAG: thioredoxin [Candidatus Verstraetearchaeota archaeon]RLE51618.1 MAG: thioredoxin [Candidatus Verstraetearchaeota archaeon]